MTDRDLNRKIISCLNQDGRKSIREVARELEVSPSTVSKHLSDLQSTGAIKRFKPVLDYDKLGLNLTAITKIEAKGDEIQKIVKELKEEDSLTHVYEITGEFDIMVIGKFNSRENMNTQIKSMLNDPAVEHTDTSIVLNVVKEDDNAQLGENLT